jgi:hypothetical protein
LAGFSAAAAAFGRAVVLTGVLFVVRALDLLLAAAGRGFGLAAAAAGGRAEALVFAVEAARELFFVDFAVEAAVVLFRVAFRTGAFSAPERLASGFGRVPVLAANLGLFAGEALEPLLATGREDGLFVLLLTDSLMRSSIIKMTPVSKPETRAV